MSKRKNNKRVQIPMTTFLVAKGDQALAAGSLVGAGTSLGVADSQLGMVAYDHEGTVPVGSFLTAGQTTADADTVMFVQGTPNSSQIQKADPFKTNAQSKIDSGKVIGSQVLSVTTRKFEVARQSAVVIKDLSGIVADGIYRADFALQGHRKDLQEGYALNEFTGTSTVPPTLPADPVDFVLQDWALDFNGLSELTVGSESQVVFGLSLAGGAGTALSAIAAGTTIQFQTIGATTYSLTFDTGMVAALQEAIVNTATTGITGATTIEVLGDGVNAVDAILVMGLDVEPALAFDEVSSTKTHVFNARVSEDLTATVEFASRGVEGSNTARQVDLWFRDRAKLRQGFMQTHPKGDFFLESQSYIDTTIAGYTVTILEYFDTVDSLNDDTDHYSQAVFCIPAQLDNPAATAAVPYTTSTADTATVTSLNAIVQPWLDSIPGIKYYGEATKAVPFI